ncbi:2OG-Fe(II) oxygenase family protein [Sphingomonas sp.]|uniref:2OG-Fe(II) oxygenase family protein n=1 Tax=Sphingomonas sp. TaxID=28214 RepID=UPI002DD667E3|nr:putative 2OG-Fe(II) oxygenase [Sphingomonas sp.]
MQPGDPEQAIDAAIGLRDAGRGDEAVTLLRAALDRHPRNPRLWQTLGTVHRALEQSTDAIDAFAEVARLAPADFRARYGVAQASLEAGRPATALFEALHRSAPGDGSVLLGRAAAQLAEGRLDDAIGGLDAIVAANSLWFDGQATLARLRWMAGDVEGFDSGYRRALAAQPGQSGLWIALIDVLTHVERFAAAREAVIAAREATGDSQVLRAYAAQIASELGDLAEADTGFAALADWQDNGIVEQHARHLLRAGRPEAAAARVEPLLGDPQAGRLWPYASLAWRLTGDRRAAWLEGDPALIGEYDLGLSMGELAALADRLRCLHVARRDPLGQSVRGGTQTDGPLFAHEAREIRQLRAAIVEAIERHIAALGPADPAHPTLRHVGKRFRFAGSWSVRLTGAGHHSTHIHPQGWLSSACYIALPDQAEMGAEPAGWLQLGAPPASLGLDLPPYRRVRPTPGHLVLFPSTMWHGTEPIAGGERLTVAFDVAATA